MDDEIIEEFVVESMEGIDRLDEALVQLESTPDDAETITEIFRILHTIKGTCGFLGFDELERVAHRGENLLSLLRDRALTMNSEIADALLATVDAIRNQVSMIARTGSEGDTRYNDLVAELERLGDLESSESSESSEVDVDAGGQSEPEVESAEEGDAADPDDEGADAEGLDAGDLDAGDLDAEDLDAGDLDAEDLDAGDLDAEDLDAEGDEAEEEAEEGHEPGSSASSPASGGAARPPGGVGRDESARLGDMLVAANEVTRADVEMAATAQAMGDRRSIGTILIEQGKTTKEAVDRILNPQKKKAQIETIRVDVALLDQLMNLVGELVLSRNQIVQLSEKGQNHEFAPPAQRLNLITTELQEEVMKTRMQPIGSVWNKLPRVVRDLSHQFGKEIRLELEGKETELDRTIIEAIKDPLTHMVRNTLDHGIETPDEREAAGKPREGVLRLRANHEGGQVNLDVSDDGKGIDPEAIRAKAVSKGLVSAEAAAEMNDAQAIQMVFLPGFSTAEKVSNVSGRGVGMDVVRTNIERIGGSIEIKSEVGRGTTFKIKIPLTLAIIPALTVGCGGEFYAIPQISLSELVRLQAGGPNGRIEDVHGAPVYRLRGRLLPIIYLADVLGVEARTRNKDVTNIVVLQADEHQFGLVVDEIEDTKEIVVKPLGREIKQLPYFSGATIMGDGTVSLILDVMGLAQQSKILNPGSRRFEGYAEPETVETKTDRGVLQTLLLVRATPNVKVAIPLDQVDRLEEFPVEEIETSDHHRVVQYRGTVMPLISAAELVGEYNDDDATRTRQSVVVCSRNGRNVGITVDLVHDIVADAKRQPATAGGLDTTVIDGKITDIIEVTSMIAQRVSGWFDEPQADVNDGFLVADGMMQ